jgi:hypothetical protein
MKRKIGGSHNDCEFLSISRWLYIVKLRILGLLSANVGVRIQRYRREIGRDQNAEEVSFKRSD